MCPWGRAYLPWTSTGPRNNNHPLSFRPYLRDTTLILHRALRVLGRKTGGKSGGVGSDVVECWKVVEPRKEPRRVNRAGGGGRRRRRGGRRRELAQRTPSPRYRQADPPGLPPKQLRRRAPSAGTTPWQQPPWWECMRSAPLLPPACTGWVSSLCSLAVLCLLAVYASRNHRVGPFVALGLHPCPFDPFISPPPPFSQLDTYETYSRAGVFFPQFPAEVRGISFVWTIAKLRFEDHDSSRA